jgi:hypothetical protein
MHRIYLAYIPRDWYVPRARLVCLDLALHGLLAQHAGRNLFVEQQVMVVYYNRLWSYIPHSCLVYTSLIFRVTRIRRVQGTYI